MLRLMLQVWYDGAVTAIGDVLVDGRAHLLWQLREQVGCVVNAQFLDVFAPIGINRVWPGLFRSWNVRTGDDDALDFRNTGRRRCFLSGCDSRQEQINCCYVVSGTPDPWSLNDKLLSLNFPRCLPNARRDNNVFSGNYLQAEGGCLGPL